MNAKKAFSTFAATKSQEPDLKEYFVTTSSLHRIKEEKNICMVSGLKGVGKTASYRALTEFDKKTDLVVGISHEFYTSTVTSSNLRAIAYSHEFEYEIAIEFLRRLIVEPVLNKKIEKKLLQSAERHVSTFIEDLKNLGGRVNSISVLGCGFNLADPSQKVLTGLKGREDELATVATLKSICESGIRLRLVIDDPEEVFLPDRNLNPYLLGGLLLACAKINSLALNIRVIVLLKAHVYDFAKSNTADLDKYPNSHLSICWDEGALVDVLKNRVKFFLDATDKTWLSLLFGETSAAEEHSIMLSFVFQRIRNGPRELLAWIYEALVYNEQKKIPYLTLEALQSTYDKVSNDSFLYFNSSNGEEFPEIGSVVQIVFEGLEDKEFTKQELASHIQKLLASNDDFQKLSRTHTWMQSVVSSKFPELFFRVGVINLVDKNEIYPFMCSYNYASYNRIQKLKLTPIFKHHFDRN